MCKTSYDLKCSNVDKFLFVGANCGFDSRTPDFFFEVI